MEKYINGPFWNKYYMGTQLNRVLESKYRNTAFMFNRYIWVL